MNIVRKTILMILSCSIFSLSLLNTPAFSYQGEIYYKSWFDEELAEKKKILEAFWQARVVLHNQKSIDDFKLAIINSHYPKDQNWENKIEKLFNDAINKKINFDLFFNTLKDQPFVLIEMMNDVEKLTPQETFKDTKPHVNKYELEKLQQYVIDKHLSASITLGSKNAKLITPIFPENHSNDAFAIHSVGKVFTSILVLIMVEEKILTENDLLQPVQLDDDVIRQLPPSVREQLKKVTLYQLMTHRAGLGDYLEAYCLAISSGHVPVMKKVEDFLPFVEDTTYPIGEFRYSNAGILLVGLAIKRAYEKKIHHPIDYNDILQRYIINKVGMNSFSTARPQNARFNLNDPIAPFIVGSPAGGYWLTAEDLAKFGQWIYRKAHADPEFRRLIEKYGQEFYYADRQMIAHGGGIPSSMAFFSVSLKTGAIQATLSDQPSAQASDLKEMIIRHIFSRKISPN